MGEAGTGFRRIVDDEIRGELHLLRAWSACNNIKENQCVAVVYVAQSAIEFIVVRLTAS